MLSGNPPTMKLSKSLHRGQQSTTGREVYMRTGLLLQGNNCRTLRSDPIFPLPRTEECYSPKRRQCVPGEQAGDTNQKHKKIALGFIL